MDEMPSSVERITLIAVLGARWEGPAAMLSHRRRSSQHEYTSRDYA
jgi:hypothetical protein